MTSQPPAASPSELVDCLRATLAAALLEDQKNENAFEAHNGPPMNRRAMIDAANRAWKAYDDTVSEIAAALDLASRPEASASEGEIEAGAIRMCEQAMWSPASGPVSWTPELIAKAKEQAAYLARSILALPSRRPGVEE